MTRSVSPGACASSSTKSGAASRRCSALSSTRRSSRSRRVSTRASTGRAPGAARASSARAIVPATSSGSCTEASGTNAAPFANPAVALCAAASASRVSPVPPAPLSTSSRTSSRHTSSWTSASSRVRPIRRFGAEGTTNRRPVTSGDAVSAGNLPEDAALQVGELLARLEAELVAEVLAGVPRRVARERFGLAAAAIKREHPRAVCALAQWMLGGECAEVCEHVGVPAERELGCEALLLAEHAQLGESLRLFARELLVRQRPERLAPPQLERAWRQARDGKRGVARAQGVASFAEQPFESCAVEGPVRHFERVARSARRDSRRLGQLLAQLRDIHLQQLARRNAGGAPPRRPRSACRPSGCGRRRSRARQAGAAASAPRTALFLGPGELDRAQHANFHRPPFPLVRLRYTELKPVVRNVRARRASSGRSGLWRMHSCRTSRPAGSSTST